MTTKDFDTDPCTPGAKRMSDPRTPAAPPVSFDDSDPVLPGSTTEPGIAPPPEPLPVPQQPLGIIVPGVAARPNDSIDVLLDGITGFQPERTRTTPQSAGQAAATYHTEHVVRAAWSSPEEEPKVVVDRPALAKTLPVGAAFPSIGASEGPRRRSDTTTVSPPPIKQRVLMAVVAGLVVVVAIFVMLDRTSPPAPVAEPMRGTRPSAPAPVVAPPAPSVQAGMATARATVASPSAIADEAPEAPATSASASRKTGPSSRPSKSRPKGVTIPAKTKGQDLGEFKTSF